MDIGTKRLYGVLSRGTKEARVYSGFPRDTRKVRNVFSLEQPLVAILRSFDCYNRRLQHTDCLLLAWLGLRMRSRMNFELL